MNDQKFDPPSYPHNESNVPPPEYRIRTVVRHVVTRYCHPYTVKNSNGDGIFNVNGGSSVICEVPSEQGAYDIATALALAEGATVQQN